MTYMREELGIEVLTLTKIDSLILEFHIELSAKWHKYTSTHQINVELPKAMGRTNLARCGADAQTDMGKP